MVSYVTPRSFLFMNITLWEFATLFLQNACISFSSCCYGHVGELKFSQIAKEALLGNLERNDYLQQQTPTKDDLFA